MALHHIVSARDFSYTDLLHIFRTTADFKTLYQDPLKRRTLKYILERDGEPLRFRILHSGPSTRTIATFEDAIEALGGTVKTNPLKFSSVSKGEAHRSILRVLGPRIDGMIIRDDNDDDAAQKMADAVTDYHLPLAVINAGSGSREHSTQMLVDKFTIWERDRVRFESGTLICALVGDLSHSRTIHSLLLGFKHFGGTIYTIGPKNENIPEWLEKEIAESSVLRHIKITDPLEIAGLVDYWYFTRLQSNLRNKKLSAAQLKKYIEMYGATDKLRHAMNPKAWALHPLPANEEYPENIDLIDPRFIHYEQADNGFFVRMALLKLIFRPSADLRMIVTQHQMIPVSGFFMSPIEISAELISAICASPSCPYVRVRGDWVETDPVFKKELFMAKVVCPRCHPTIHKY